MASQDDRKALSSLYGIGSTTKKPVPYHTAVPKWTQEPTLIPIPQNPHPYGSPRSRQSVNNPYERIGQSNSTNPTASKTLLSGKPKPRKTVRDGVAKIHSPLSTGSSNKGKGKAVDSPAKSTRNVSPEIIDVDADHASIDELNLIAERPVISSYFKSSSPPKRASPNKPNPLPESSSRNPAPPTKDWPISSPRLVKDGKYTNELKARHNQNHLLQRGSSPIDSFMDDDIMVETRRVEAREKSMSVKEQVARIEALNYEPVKHIPALPVRNFKKTTIKQKMQPRSGASKFKPSHELLRDPLTEPSGLRSSSASTKNDVMRLPISSVVLGLQQLSEFEFLDFETGAFSLASSGRPTGPRFTADLIKNCRCSAKNSDAKLDKYILHITTVPQTGTHLSWQSNYLSVFHFGDNVKGTVTILFDECHESWDIQTYKRCIEALNIPGGKISYLRSWSPLWKAALSQIKYAPTNDQSSCHSNRAIEKERISNERHTLDLSVKPFSEETDISVRTAKSRPVPRPTRKRSASAPNDAIETVEEVEVEPPQKRQRIDEPKNVRRSIRQQDKDKDKDKDKAPKVDQDELILVYPLGVPGAVNLTVGDLNRLQPEEFLNDTLIEFGLKSWLKELELENPELAAQIHVFNSFFYKKFNKRNVQEGYDSVRKWTSRIDIFSKKYIIVPINENLHWYLALIYEPEHILRPPSPSLQQPQTPSTRKQTRETQAESSATETTTLPAEEITTEAEAEARPPSVSEDQPMDDDNNSEKEVEELAFSTSCSITIATDKTLGDSAPDLKSLLSPKGSKTENLEVGIPMDVNDGIDDVGDVEIFENDEEKSTMSESTIGSNRDSPIDITEDSQPTTLMGTIAPSRFYGKPNGKQRQKKLVQEDEPIVIEVDAKEEPRTKIFIMDSLGNRHPQAMKQLGKWLQLEALDKKKVENITPPISKLALVPNQPNFCDCGLYILHFAKTFLSDPQRYCDLIMKKERPGFPERKTDWKDASVREMRDELRHKILQYSEEWRQYRAAREPEKQTEEEDEDSDVAIVEHIQPPKKGKANKGTRTKG